MYIPLTVSGRHDYVVGLAGNPNTGKSTVFNFLTGLRQHTGNWPGKTVVRAEGTFTHGGKNFRLIDLPGTYSLWSQSADEDVARNFLLFERPHCTIVVCDATVLERNLHLVLQILEITDRVVVCANLMDEANRRRIALEARALESEVGAPVVPTVARRGKGLDLLMEKVHDVAAGRRRNAPDRLPLDEDIEKALSQLTPKLAELYPGLPCPRWIALRLLDGDEQMEQAMLHGELPGAAGEVAPSKTEAAA